MEQTTLDAFLEIYAQLQTMTNNLYNLADAAVDTRNYNDANLLQARADILYEQMENLNAVISEYEV
ncbi:MAG: hypothetical protein PUP91_09160 [Rhizonema sp. PD37]|nr:hypothetical protein [Rhizonema sp. PD37]